MTRKGETMGEKANAALLVVEKLRLLLDRTEGLPSDDQQIASVEQRLAGGEAETRSRLIRLFNLRPEEVDAIDCAVAVAVEPALGARIGALQGSPGRLLPNAVALRLLFGHRQEPFPRSGSALRSWQLVRLHQFKSGEPVAIEADPAIVEWYFGLPSLAGIDGLSIAKVKDIEPLAEWDVEATAQRIAAAIAKGMPTRVIVSGLEGSGRSSLACALAVALGRRAVLVTPSRDDPQSAVAVARFHRLMLLMGGVAPVWRGNPTFWPGDAMMAALQFVVVAADTELPRLSGVVDIPIAMPALTIPSRDRMARAMLPKAVAASLSPLGAPRLADLADASAMGIADAEAFHRFLRQRTHERIKGVGHLVKARFGWDDLVLAAPTKKAIRAIEIEARARERLLQDPERRRLFESTSALTALFSGPPGVGKSMAGQVVAAALSLDLLVIDSAAISSKYIGDTAKNLSNAFAVAREANCAVMFEEADGMFARRVIDDSVNARHANADTGHLLQLIEAHSNLVMLSTNRRGAIDPAFLRRLRFIVDFQPSEVPERVELWTRMLCALGLSKKKAMTLAEPVAAAHPISAAQIKSAALTAAFLAQERNSATITPDLLLAGIGRELAKEGRTGEMVMPLRGGRRMHG